MNIWKPALGLILILLGILLFVVANPTHTACTEFIAKRSFCQP